MKALVREFARQVVVAVLFAVSVRAGEVIVRHLRSWRGFLAVGNSGDSIGVKPKSTGVDSEDEGTMPDAFQKRKAKKDERGKVDYRVGCPAVALVVILQ